MWIEVELKKGSGGGEKPLATNPSSRQVMTHVGAGKWWEVGGEKGAGSISPLTTKRKSMMTLREEKGNPKDFA